ncbi:YopX family protein [Macrococcoides caseolyticum]|uniref:YopX family protein n=1 Tax=Macrococcoides caseolyticum TaxID=69966 RepID=UPI000C34CBB8|nr:YopX family protein [Macrococcus caseolyticus]PKE22762.1 hypothetical protein CW688_01130 [Macrococcus caseolyticus]
MIPKFRIFDKKKKRFLGDFTMEIDKFGIHVLDEFNYVVDEDDRVLMQSTGLTDVNGKEIFEGDIVKVSQDDDYFISFVKNMIEFDCPGFDVPFPDDWDYECNVLSHLMNTDQTIEVIGNVHSHSHLLGSERDRK